MNTIGRFLLSLSLFSVTILVALTVQGQTLNLPVDPSTGTVTNTEMVQSVNTPEVPPLLTGDKRLSCEMILCLSAAGNTPGECANAMAKYDELLSISMFDPSALVRFMNQCPMQ